jgi:GNAT superfamily N-acetyltransferase
VISRPCGMCGTVVEGEDLEAYGWAGLAHVRQAHTDLPYGDMAVRNFLEGEARMTGGSERLDTIGEVEIHPVTEDRIDDWLEFFDHHMAVGTPQNSGCYCLEPHELTPHEPLPAQRHWTERRATMIDMLRQGHAFGYLAYVDGRPAGWVNASLRGNTTLFRRGDDQDARTATVACFALAPPYLGHGLAPRLLARVVADAGARGADWVEAYPAKPGVGTEPNFRGPRAMYERAGFQEVKIRTYDMVVRKQT